MSRSSTLVFAAIALALSHPVQGQPRQAVPQVLPQTAGVIVDQVAYEPVKRMVTIAFRNSSNLEVTAFGWTLTVPRPGASALQHHEVIDLLPLFALRATKMNPTDPTNNKTSFGPGETYSIRWYTPMIWGTINPDGITCEVTSVVIYSDASAIGEMAVIEEVFASRRASIAADMDVLTQIRAVPRDAEGGTRLAALKEHYDSAVWARSQSARRSAILSQMLAVYERSGWAYVDELTRAYQARAEFMSQQSHRKER